MKRSWKTTTAGIAVIITVIGQVITLLTDGDPLTNPDWNTVMTQLIPGIGLLVCRDFDKSSEDQCIVKPKA